MVLPCRACGAQNFVAPERRAVAGVPPLCWKCGARLPERAETDPDGPESKRGKSGGPGSGEERNA